MQENLNNNIFKMKLNITRNVEKNDKTMNFLKQTEQIVFKVRRFFKPNVDEEHSDYIHQQATDKGVRYSRIGK